MTLIKSKNSNKLIQCKPFSLQRHRLHWHRLIKALLKDGNFYVQALVRKGSEHKLPRDCEIIIGDPLNAASYQNKIAASATFVHLVGVAHPLPPKKCNSKKSTWYQLGKR